MGWAPEGVRGGGTGGTVQYNLKQSEGSVES